MKRYAVGIIIAAVFACFWLLLGSLLAPNALERDFLSFYTGGSIAAAGELGHVYDRGLQREYQTAAHAGDVFMPFIRPPFYAAALAVLTWLDYAPAFWLWLGLHASLVVALWVWSGCRWGSDALALAAMFLPAPLAVASGQDTVLLAWVALAAFLCAERGREGLAGCLLALGLFKFHLLLLMPAAMLVQRRYRMLSGFAAVSAVEGASAIAVVGIRGLAEYAALLGAKDLATLHPSPDKWISVHGLVAHLTVTPIDGLLLLGSALFLVAAWSLLAVGEGGLLRLWAIGLTGSLLLVPHVYGYDAALLAGPVALVMWEWPGRLGRIAGGVLATPLVFLAGIAGGAWAALPAVALCLFLAAIVRDTVDLRPLEVDQ